MVRRAPHARLRDPVPRPGRRVRCGDGGDRQLRGRRRVLPRSGAWRRPAPHAGGEPALRRRHGGERRRRSFDLRPRPGHRPGSTGRLAPPPPGPRRGARGLHRPGESGRSRDARPGAECVGAAHATSGRARLGGGCSRPGGARRSGVPAGWSVSVPRRCAGLVARRRGGRHPGDRPRRRTPRRGALRRGVRRDLRRAQPARGQCHTTGHVHRCACPRAHGTAPADTIRCGRHSRHRLVAVVAGPRRHRPRRTGSVVGRRLPRAADRGGPVRRRRQRTHRGRPDATSLGDGVRGQPAAPGARLGASTRHGPQRHLLCPRARPRRLPSMVARQRGALRRPGRRGGRPVSAARG